MTASCPTTERWKKHLDGSLAPEAQDELTAHLDQCAACQRTLEHLAAGGDSLLDVARQVGQATEATDGVQAPTPPSPTQALETQAEAVKPTDDDLAFLCPPTKANAIGRLAHYEALDVIGKGGFGIVLKAFDEKLHRVAAIKVLAPSLAASGTARRRFIREAQAAAAVKNEHVVAIYNVEDEAQPPYLVMELIDGVSLQEKLDKQGPLSLKEILRIGMQMAEGLAAAHKQGLVHRDIKPSNILLENGVERVKITDFGLARAVDDASVTQSGVIAGTPMYMSPEQAEGLPIDHRSDLFSLGTVLYAMCSGHPPFRASGTHAVLKRVIDAAPRPIREINNEVPEWLCEIISKLHAKKPEDRFQTAKEVAELLGQRLADVQAWRAGSVSDRSEASASAAPTPVAHAPGSPRRSALRRAALILVPLLVLAAIVSLFLPRQAEIRRDLRKVGVLSLRLSDMAMQYRIDGHGANQTGVGVIQLPMDPGQHKVWFALGDRQFETKHFTISAGKTTELSLEVKGDDGRAILDGRPHQVTRISTQSGWVQLFNGKDLGGWQTLPNQFGKWEVTNRILTMSGPTTYLFRKVAFKRFHLRLVARGNDTGGGEVYCQVPELPVRGAGPGGPHISINRKEGFRHVISSGFTFTHPAAPPGEWFTLEIRVDGPQTEITVNGGKSQVVDGANPPGGPYIALSSSGLEFKTIEIKELSGRRLPETADQVLPALAGAWKGEYTQKIYAGKPDAKKISAVAVNDWIIGQKWLRQRVQLEKEGFQSVTSFEPGSKTYRDWFFHSRGLIFGPSTGRWDSATRTLTWTNLPEAGVILLMTLRFVDANVLAGEILIRDKEGKTVFEMSSQLQRTSEKITLDENVSSGPLPPEMAVLDRLVGDWQCTGVFKNPTSPDGTKIAWQKSSRRILGGRVIATHATGLPDDKENYSLATFDTFSKAFGFWLFKADGAVLDHGGGWHDATQTMKWNWAAKDGSHSSSSWQWRDANRLDWHVVTKDALGKTTHEIQSTAVRQKEPGWVQLFNRTDLTGLTLKPKQSWTVAGGILVSQPAFGHVSADKRFRDFHCRTELKLDAGATGGLGVRVQTGLGAGILLGKRWQDGKIDSRPKTGSIYQNVNGKTELPAVWTKDLIKPDGWFVAEVIVRGSDMVVKIDGVETARRTLTDLPEDGGVGISASAGKIHVRKFEIKELPPSPAPAIAPFDAASIPGDTRP